MNRTIATLGILAVLVAIYVLVLEPMSEKRVYMQEQLKTNYVTLVKYQKYQKQKGQSSKRLEVAQKALEMAESPLLSHSDTSVAFARLQLDVQRLAAMSGLQVTSVKPLPAVEFKHYTGLPIFLDCTGDIKDLGEFLKSLDARDVLFGIDRLNVAAQQNGRLRVKIQLTGLMLTS
jgi:Tfp pilus assembly protein PilO